MHVGRPYSARVEGASRQRLSADMHAQCKTQEPADGRPPSSVLIQRQVAAFQVILQGLSIALACFLLSSMHSCW